MRVLELFAGIGGFASAFPNLEIVHAVDIDQTAACVYSANFPGTYSIKEIASLPLSWFDQQGADLWWMSPPCTPFSQRGNQMDLDDPRSSAIKHLIHTVAAIRPSMVCLENVVGFERSRTFAHLNQEWTRIGYSIQTLILCPTELGWPNRRPRVYCIASLKQQEAFRPPKYKPIPLSHFLDLTLTPGSQPSLWLDQKTSSRYLAAMDRVTTTSESSVTACFAASYGKAIVRSGSYLDTPWGYRRFSPREVARLLGFDDAFVLPDTLSFARQWHLLGNSLSLPALRHALSGVLHP